MTDMEIAALGPAFSQYLGRYRSCFLQERSAKHFDNYCRALLSDLPRKTVEPIALACGTAVRTLQDFLVTTHWEQNHATNLFQQHFANLLCELPEDPIGVVGVIDETSCVKKGDQTPGVQRQYLGCVGKIDNGIVTVHVGVAVGQLRVLLAADLFVPKGWILDRPRCRAAGIPDHVRHRSKWRIALDQLVGLHQNGVRFDWLTFDEGYSKKTFLWLLNRMTQKFVAEVPKSFRVRLKQDGPLVRADEIFSETVLKSGRRFRLTRETQRAQRWRAVCANVRVGRDCFRLVVAINEETGEVKYFLSNGISERLQMVLQVAFRRWTVEHCFRVTKQEAGLMHYEGRDYRGLLRHLTLSLIVMGFVSIQTDRLREKKSPDHDGAGVSCVECEMPAPSASSAGHS